MRPSDNIEHLIQQTNYAADPARRKQILNDASQALRQSRQEKPAFWRNPMQKLSIKAVAAAVIAVAVLFGINQFGIPIDGVGVALADVAKKMEEIQTCAFEKTTTIFTKDHGAITHKSLAYYGKGGYREDIYKDKSNEAATNQVYINYSQGTIIGIDHKMKMYNKTNLSEEDKGNCASMSPGDIVNLILSKGDYKKLGRKMVDGVLSDGFGFNDKRTLLSMEKDKTQDVKIRLWVDVNTNWPVRVEADAVYNNIKASVVQNKPRWNIELDSGFFELMIPSDYVKLKERGLLGIDITGWPKLKVNPGTAAGKAGLKDGDVVLRVNDASIEHIKSSDEAQQFLLGKAGEKATFTVKRGEQVMTIEVVREPLVK